MSIQETNPEAKAYFDSLPLFVQESIMQSGANFNDIDQLKQCAQNLMQPEE